MFKQLVMDVAKLKEENIELRQEIVDIRKDNSDLQQEVFTLKEEVTYLKDQDVAKQEKGLPVLEYEEPMQSGR